MNIPLLLMATVVVRQHRPTGVIYGSTYGELATVSRTGYTFDGWFTTASGGSEVTASTTVTTADDHTLYAHWTQVVTTHTLTFSAGTGGSITAPVSSPQTYDAGTVVTITASPSAGYSFDGWTGDTGSIANTSSASTTITMDGNYTIQANFTQIDYTLTVTVTPAAAVTGGCSVSGASATYHYGDSVSLSADAGTGWQFDNWAGDQTSGSFSMPASNVSITANFTQIDYTLTVQLPRAPA